MALQDTIVCWEFKTNNCFEYHTTEQALHIVPLSGCWNELCNFDSYRTKSGELFLVIFASANFQLVTVVRPAQKIQKVWSGNQGFQTVTAAGVLEKQGRVFYGNEEGAI